TRTWTTRHQRPACCHYTRADHGSRNGSAAGADTAPVKAYLRHWRPSTTSAPPMAGSDRVPFGPAPRLRPTPVDPRRSPYTGLTRRHWLDLADHLLTAAAQYATADGAMIRPPGRESVSGPASDGLEGFARTF